MKSLFAPWRMEYILADRQAQKCIFCPREGHTDRKRLILYRTPFSLVMLNRYPYAYAHLMVAPIRHTHDFSKLKVEEMTDMFQNLRQSIKVLKEACHPNGFNIGMNLGQVGGAGILRHLHFHVIPRWKGDVNFMPAIADVRIIPEHLQQTYRRLLPYFKKCAG